MVLRALGYSVAFVAKSRDRAACASKVKRSVACLKWLLSHGTKHWNWLSASGLPSGAGDRLEPMFPQG